MVLIQHERVWLVELTIPWEHNILNARTRKIEKYSELKRAVCNLGYVVELVALEVTSRGIVTSSVDAFLHKVMPRKDYKKVAARLSRMVMQCAYTIWNHRDQQRFPRLPVTKSVATDNVA